MSRLWVSVWAAIPLLSLLSAPAGAGHWTIVNRTRMWRAFIAPGPPPYAESPASPAFTFTMWAYLDPWNQRLNQGGWPYLSLFTVRSTAANDYSRLPAVYVCLPASLHVSTNWAGDSYGAITPASVQAAWLGQWMFLAVVIDNTAAQQVALYYAANATTALTLLPGNTNGQALPLRTSAVFSTDFQIQTALVVLHNVTLYDRALSAPALDQVKSTTAPPPMPFTSGQSSYQASGNLAGGFVYEWVSNSPLFPEPAPATNGLLTVLCPVSGTRITRVLFASYGTPQGDFPSFTIGPVHANASLAVVQQRCLSRTSCTLQANDTTFAPDPAPDVRKWFAVVVQCNGRATTRRAMSPTSIRRHTTIPPPATPRTNPSSRRARVSSRQRGTKQPTLTFLVRSTTRALARVASGPATGGAVRRGSRPVPHLSVAATSVAGMGPRAMPVPPSGGPAGTASDTGGWPLSKPTTVAVFLACVAVLLLAITVAYALKCRRQQRMTMPVAAYLGRQPQWPIVMQAPSSPAVPYPRYFPAASLDASGTTGSGRHSAATAPNPTARWTSARRSRREQARDKFDQGAYTTTTTSDESSVEL